MKQNGNPGAAFVPALDQENKSRKKLSKAKRGKKGNEKGLGLCW